MAVKVRTEVRELPCDLNDAEVQMAGEEMAKKYAEIIAEQEAQAQAKAEMKARMKELNVELGKFAVEVTHRLEMRPVEIELILDTKNLQVKEVRKDTGEVLTIRQANKEEAQATFGN